MLELGLQRPPMILETAQLTFPELALPAQFTPLLFRQTRDANGLQLVLVPLQMAREPHAQLARAMREKLPLRGDGDCISTMKLNPHSRRLTK